MQYVSWNLVMCYTAVWHLKSLSVDEWPWMSLKVIGVAAVDWAIYHFQLVACSNNDYIWLFWHKLRDIATQRTWLFVTLRSPSLQASCKKYGFVSVMVLLAILVEYWLVSDGQTDMRLLAQCYAVNNEIGFCKLRIERSLTALFICRWTKLNNFIRMSMKVVSDLKQHSVMMFYLRKYEFIHVYSGIMLVMEVLAVLFM